LCFDVPYPLPNCLKHNGDAAPKEPFEAQLLTYAQSEIVNFAYSSYLCVLCGSMNKQRLFASTDWV